MSRSLALILVTLSDVVSLSLRSLLTGIENRAVAGLHASERQPELHLGECFPCSFAACFVSPCFVACGPVH